MDHFQKQFKEKGTVIKSQWGNGAVEGIVAKSMGNCKPAHSTFPYCYRYCFIKEANMPARPVVAAQAPSGPPGAQVVERTAKRRTKKGQNNAEAVVTVAVPHARPPTAPRPPVPLDDASLQSVEEKVLPLCRHFGSPLHVRGIVNPASNCFAAAVLQSLMCCAPFVHLCALLSRKAKDCPVTASLGQWVMAYMRATPCALSPPRLELSGSLNGETQADAHEFLIALLSAVSHELSEAGYRTARGCDRAQTAKKRKKPTTNLTEKGETEAAATPSGSGSPPEVPGKGWLVVGCTKGMKKLAIHETSQSQEAAEDPIFSIFGGRFHNYLSNSQASARGVTSVTVEPFVVWPVDVGFEARTTLESAVARAAAKEAVADDERGVTMKKAVLVGALPQIIIFQLMRWATTREGECVKLGNEVAFGPRLTIPSVAVARENGAKKGGSEYSLLSVVCHRGNSPTGGHYVCYCNPASRALPCEASSSSASDSDFPLLLANDAHVSRSTLKEAIQDTPYFVMYEKIS